MILQENKYANLSGVFPDALMIDASGPGLTDGSEFVALQLNDGWEPFSQAIMFLRSIKGFVGTAVPLAPSLQTYLPNECFSLENTPSSIDAPRSNFLAI